MSFTKEELISLRICSDIAIALKSSYDDDYINNLLSMGAFTSVDSMRSTMKAIISVTVEALSEPQKIAFTEYYGAEKAANDIVNAYLKRKIAPLRSKVESSLYANAFYWEEESYSVRMIGNGYRVCCSVTICTTYSGIYAEIEDWKQKSFHIFADGVQKKDYPFNEGVEVFKRIQSGEIDFEEL